MKKPGISLDALEPFFEKIGKLSQIQRILICIVTFVILIGAFVYFSFLPKLQQKKELTTELEQLDQQLLAAKRQAAKLEKYRNELAKADEQFKVVMQSLPNDKEIPALLASISRSGQESGLEFILFEPKGENRKEFYSEIPISIKVEGSYHNVELFFDKISRLSRIVNIEKIKMRPEKKSDKLTTSCTALTYRFVESADKEPKK